MWSSFDWDKRKSDANIDKHGIDFEDVWLVFEDYVLVRASLQEHGEKRWIALGFLEDIPVAVVYTVRPDNVCRIISARKARHGERAAYEAARRRASDQAD